jgi:NADH:ubiquinone oxidoreductase subunit E
MLTGRYQLQVCADSVNLLGAGKNIMKNAEAVLRATKEVDVKVNVEKLSV